MSGLEDGIALALDRQNLPYSYEEHILNYEQPAKDRKYRPDFVLHNGIIIEAKGRFVTADRQKHLMIADQYPALDIRFVFSNPRNKISKRSKTTYEMWCRKHQFDYAKEAIPRAWLQEPAYPDRVDAAMELLGWEPPVKPRKKKRSKRKTK